MSKAKTAITSDKKIASSIDRLVPIKAFLNRSRTIEDAIREKLARPDKSRLAKRTVKLDPEYEQVLAGESIVKDSSERPLF